MQHNGASVTDEVTDSTRRVLQVGRNINGTMRAGGPVSPELIVALYTEAWKTNFSAMWFVFQCSAPLLTETSDGNSEVFAVVEKSFAQSPSIVIEYVTEYVFCVFQKV